MNFDSTSRPGEDQKPCPFCGNQPRYLPLKAGFYAERVICDTCHFHLPPEQWSSRADGAKEI